MTQKKLENGSRFDKYDMDGDGVVSDEEIAREKEIIEMELREEKSAAQKRMAWVAIASMISFSIFLFLPIVSDNRVKALGRFVGPVLHCTGGRRRCVYGYNSLDE